MSGDVALVDSGDGAISRLVRTASTLFASPDFRPTALVGGLAVTVRLATVHRATNDVDTVSEGEGPRDLALQYLGDANAAAANRIEIDGVKVDVMATWPLPSTSAELPDVDLDRLFVLGQPTGADVRQSVGQRWRQHGCRHLLRQAKTTDPDRPVWTDEPPRLALGLGDPA